MTISVILVLIAVALYIVKYYDASPPSEMFSVDDTVDIGNPYHPDYPKRVTILSIEKDSCVCRITNGEVKSFKQSDLTKQAF